MISSAHDKLLFTPGPLTTSLAVKQAMLHDAGSWHYEFTALVAKLRARVLKLAGVGDDYVCVLMQGSGTFGVEATLSTAIPPKGKVLILANGAYGERMVLMTQALRIESVVLRTAEDTPPDLQAVEKALKNDESITHVAVVHGETTTGIINPIEEIGQLVARMGRVYIVDAMSSFAAVPIDFGAAKIDYLISSPNKCIEGVPGFSFVIAKREKLFDCEGYARSLSLDLLGQIKTFEKTGQFRYTPPTHSILAFERALEELENEGGISGRAKRYQDNHNTLRKGMKRLGFKSYLPDAVQSYLITSFYFPADAKFTFADFYRRLSEKGFIIYPGKISQVDLFRMGILGGYFLRDMEALVLAIEQTVKEMGVKMEASV